MKHLKSIMHSAHSAAKRFYMTFFHIVALSVFAITYYKLQIKDVEVFVMLGLGSLSSACIHLYFERKSERGIGIVDILFGNKTAKASKQWGESIFPSAFGVDEQSAEAEVSENKSELTFSDDPSAYILNLRRRISDSLIMFVSNMTLLIVWYLLGRVAATDASFYEAQRMAVIAFSILLLAFMMPRIGKNGMVGHLTSMITRTAICCLFTLAVVLSQFFIAFSLNNLFELEQYALIINEYDIISIFGITFVFPFIFMALYPKKGENPRDLSFVYRIVVFYIAMPLLAIYTLVLYTYFLKLVVTWRFPNNTIANLVVWYLFISHVAMYIIIGVKWYHNDVEAWVAENILRYIPALIIPAVVGFLSIFIRISTYGFTVPRYLLLAFAIFNVVGLALLYFFKKRAHLPILVLAISVLYVAFFGELSSYKVTLRSQRALVKQKLELAGYSYDALVNQNIKAEDMIIDEEIADSLYENLDYLYWHDFYCDDSEEDPRVVAERALLGHVENLTGRSYIKEAYMVQNVVSEEYGETNSNSEYFTVYKDHEEVNKLWDGTYLFHVVSEGSVISVDSFMVSADNDNIYFYEGNDENPVCTFAITKEIIERKDGDNNLYKAEFSCETGNYEVIFIVDYADILYDSTKGELISDYAYNDFEARVVLRKK